MDRLVGRSVECPFLSCSTRFINLFYQSFHLVFRNARIESTVESKTSQGFQPTLEPGGLQGFF